MEANPGSPRAVTVGQPTTTSRRWRWLIVFLVGLVLWVASIVVTALTRNSNLIPTDVLLGSFLVPVTAVIWNFDHDVGSVLSGQRIFVTFVVGGVLGVLAASLLESPLAQDSLFTYIAVGFIEEAVKFGALVGAAVGLSRYTTRDGIVLGATVGFGFAALESAGYAFNALFTVQGLSLGSLVATEALRGLLAPLGHGLWTAIVGGALFHASSHGSRLRVTGGVIGAYLLVSILHGLWDAMRGIALILTALLTLASGQSLSMQSGAPAASDAQIALFNVLNFGGIVVVSLIGIVSLLVISRRWGREPTSRRPA
jgi:RsiW-degrading membrane proteinase PrsW (M82 family)